MKYYKYIFILLMTMGLSVSDAQETINIKLSDIDENGNVTLTLNIEQAPVVVELEPEEPPVIPEEPQTPQPDPTEFLFPEDWAEEQAQSTADNINLPKGISNLFDVEYLGGFRVDGRDGDSNTHYANGTLGINTESNSIYLAGRPQQSAIAEFKIPDNLYTGDDVKEMPNALQVQPYKIVLESGLKERVTGILRYKDKLIVNSNIAYDASANNKNNTQIFNAEGFAKHSDFLELEGNAKAAGYISKIPNEWQARFDAEYLTGWASNFSITSRYSQGPSLYTFDAEQAINATEKIKTKAWLVYPFGQGVDLDPTGNDTTENGTSSPLWAPMSKARYGFIVPNSDYFLVLGFTGGIHSGTGYKITQDDGNLCDGYCTFKANDIYNYFWVYNVNDILSANEPHEPKPISYGKWSHPFDDTGKHALIGAVFNDTENTLYISLSRAGSIKRYDETPLIVAYKLTVKETN